MNQMKKSRKLLFAATLLTIVALATVLGVYAAVLLGTITGGTVTVGGVSGSVTYSSTNSTSATWSSTLQPTAGSEWYARLEIIGGYNGLATVTFQLQRNTGSGWSNVGSAITTSQITLLGSSQIVYASSDGAITSNFDWGQDTSSGGAYQIIVTVNSAP